MTVPSASEPNHARPGTVYLIGAGPGDPDLITVKGLRLLRQADVILYDRLIPMDLLKETRPGAELIDVGKAPGNHKVKQGQTSQWLVDHARQGKIVVRLKGGDPFVFGRGGEEALTCAAAGVPFEVVPGVSAAVAVPAYAGIPVTHRDTVMAFTVFSGHEPPETIDAEALVAAARLGTLILLMSVKPLPGIVQRLLESGLDPATPAAVIEWGTTVHQRVVEGTLATLPQLAAQATIVAPATTVIGEVVRLREQGVRWFAENANLPNRAEADSGTSE